MSTVPSETPRFDGTVSANVQTYPDYCRLVWAAGEMGTQLAIGVDFKAFNIPPLFHRDSEGHPYVGYEHFEALNKTTPFLPEEGGYLGTLFEGLIAPNRHMYTLKTPGWAGRKVAEIVAHWSPLLRLPDYIRPRCDVGMTQLHPDQTAERRVDKLLRREHAISALYLIRHYRRPPAASPANYSCSASQTSYGGN